ncbi:MULTISPECIES: thioredoxin family protein [Ramlibacter]|uniref:Thioredoxin family protein n=1 Tax=Ramlibacter aquaticus TaxID=2780094 RepID=A0ABR9SII1_9BURK|nr:MULTISPECIES: thioredoxin family protein [Ramlibacter]MBE7942174.1 thioredoxin family protein [Ramlibacter aquaticus]
MNWLPIEVSSAIALAVAMQALMWMRAMRSVGRAAPDTSSVDGAAAEDCRRVHSAHCGPCRAIKPMVERLQLSHRDLISVDIAQQVDLARKFSVARTPSFVLVEGDFVRWVLLGGQTERKLVARLQGA